MSNHLRANGYFASHRRELDRIADQIEQYLAQAQRVAGQYIRHLVVDNQIQGDFFLARLYALLLYDFIQRLAQLKFRVFDIEFAGLNFRQVQ